MPAPALLRKAEARLEQAMVKPPAGFLETVLDFAKECLAKVDCDEMGIRWLRVAGLPGLIGQRSRVILTV